MELLSSATQLKVAARADVLVGAHGNGLAHLAWQVRGSGVLEVFPHFDHPTDGTRLQGTGFTGHYPFLSRFRGLVYRAMDSERGGFDPVGRGATDLSHQLNIDELKVNLTAVGALLDDIIAQWRSVRAALRAGEPVDMTSRWNPGAVAAQ